MATKTRPIKQEQANRLIAAAAEYQKRIDDIEARLADAGYNKDNDIDAIIRAMRILRKYKVTGEVSPYEGSLMMTGIEVDLIDGRDFKELQRLGFELVTFFEGDKLYHHK